MLILQIVPYNPYLNELVLITYVMAPWRNEQAATWSGPHKPFLQYFYTICTWSTTLMTFSKAIK